MNPWELTLREQRVLSETAKHGAAKVVAKEIGISYRTVEIYLERARKKMQTPHTVIAVLMWDRYVFARMGKPNQPV